MELNSLTRGRPPRVRPPLSLSSEWARDALPRRGILRSTVARVDNDILVIRFNNLVPESRRISRIKSRLSLIVCASTGAVTGLICVEELVIVGLCEEDEEEPDVEGWLPAEALVWKERRGPTANTVGVVTVVAGSSRVGSVFCCNGEKFLRRSEKSLPKEDPLDEVKMLVREVLVELEGEISVKVTLVGLGFPVEDEKGLGKSLVLSYAIVLCDLSEPFNGWKADDRDPNSERS